jgi:hypothetical protein
VYLTIGQDSYRVLTDERDGRWTAHAVRGDSGDRFGIEVAADSEEEATSRLSRWLEWQSQHMQALAALQLAEREYHRAMTDAAFGASAQPGGDVLEAVNSARRALDELRARRPAV